MKQFHACRSFMLVIAFMAICIAAKAGDTYSHWHYVTVKTYDSAKGLVYASHSGEDANPQFETSVDVKWYDERSSEEGASEACKPLWGYAKANEGYVFTGWSNQNDITNVISLYNPSELPTDANENLDDYPEEPEIVYYALFGKVGAAIDSISQARNYGSVAITNPLNKPGDKVTLSAIPNFPNVKFVNWTLNGAEYSSYPVISVTASYSPEVYCANFTSCNKSEYNFDKGGEWKIYYEPSLSALKPTSAQEAYVVPSSHLYSNGYFQLLPVDTLYAGTTYILYGNSDGEIEYLEPELQIPAEIASPLLYADRDIEYTASDFMPYWVYYPETKKFERVKQTSTIKKGSAYLYQYAENEPDIYAFTGVIEPKLDFVISSYRVTDLLTNTQTTVTEPQHLTLTYTKNVEDFLNITDIYLCSNFFGYNIWGQTFDYSSKDINLQPDEIFSLFLSIEQDEESGYTKEVIFVTDLESLENGNTEYLTHNPVRITYDEYNNVYSLTPFYILVAEGKTADEQDTQYEITNKYYYDQIVIKNGEEASMPSFIVKEPEVKVVNGTIYLNETAKVMIYNMQGVNVFNGETDKIKGLAKGFYIISVNGTSIKVKI